MQDAPRAEKAHPSPIQDFFSPLSPDAWQRAPADTFLTWLSEGYIGSRQFRSSSRDVYCAIFSTWVRFLESRELTLLEATARDSSAFFSQHVLEPITRRRYLLLLKRVYLHLQEKCGWARPNPLVPELKRERPIDAPLPPGLGEAEQEALIRVLADLEGWKGARDRAMAALLLGAGLRTNELVALPVTALGEAWRVRVEPQGVHRAHTTLVLPDGPWRGWLREWRIERIRRAIPGTHLCPATLKGTAYSPSGLFRRVGTWFDEAKVEADRQGAGILRNSFARCALTCDRYTLDEVKEFLGHEDARATARHLSENSAT